METVSDTENGVQLRRRVMMANLCSIFDSLISVAFRDFSTSKWKNFVELVE